MEKNLIRTLADKLKVVANAIKKSKIVKGTLASALALSVAVTVSGCNFSCQSVEPGEPPGITNPNETPGTTTPGDDVGNGNTNDNPYAQYSQILQNVLKSDYYNGLIDKFKSDFGKIRMVNPSMHSLPYGFLEDNGYDISLIKNETLSCFSLPYIKDNDHNTLYISFNVENLSGHFTNFAIKYDITEQEYQDLSMLSNGNYAQLPLFIQELSYVKNAEIVFSFNISEETYDEFIDIFNSKTEFTYSLATGKIDFLNFIDIRKNEKITYGDAYIINIDVISTGKDHLRQLKRATIEVNALAGTRLNNDMLHINYPSRMSFNNVDEYIADNTNIFSFDYQLDTKDLNV